MSDAQTLYRKILGIRLFEERLLELFSEGKLFGTTHTCIGQEANAVAVMENLDPRDAVFSSHRCHGHFLARFGDPEALLAEVMGRINGVCGGRGGSQHLCRDRFYTSGLQGGYMPICVGIAFAEKKKKTGAIAVAFIGDGTLGEGAVYESLNMASLWGVPLLVVIENNRYAQTTPIELQLAGTIIGRGEAFGIESAEIESNDIFDLLPLFKGVIEQVRSTRKPYVQVVHTYRLKAHSKGDDFRDPDEIQQWEAKDPLVYFNDKISENDRALIRQELSEQLKEIEHVVEQQAFAGS